MRHKQLDIPFFVPYMGVENGLCLSCTSCANAAVSPQRRYFLDRFSSSQPTIYPYKDYLFLCLLRALCYSIMIMVITAGLRRN